MKLIIILLITLVISVVTRGQDFTKNFIGQDFLFYKGALFVLDKNAYFGLDYKFYSDINNCQTTYNKNVIYPDEKNYSTTKKDSLVNKVFLVKNILTPSGETYNDHLLAEQPVFLLQDTSSKQEIYFKYDMRYESSFPFYTSKIVLQQQIVCSRIEKQIDEFNGITHLNSPLSKNYFSLAPIVISKDIAKTSSYYLRLLVGGATLVTDGIGVTVLFTDGTKWSKQVKIDVEADKNGYEYTAFIKLNQTDLLSFSTKRIKKFRLYIFDKELDDFEAEKIMLYISCIKGMK